MYGSFVAEIMKLGSTGEIKVGTTEEGHWKWACLLEHSKSELAICF